MANKIKFQIKPDKISEFIETLEELTRIEDTYVFYFRRKHYARFQELLNEHI